MTKICHITTDYPDDVNKVYTKAVKNLLEATDKSLNHKVISIVRRGSFKFEIIRPNNDLIVLIIPKVRLAVANFLVMRVAYSKLINAVGHNFFKEFDFVHAHKLTIDGLLGWIIAKLNHKKLVVSVRGSTDVKWINGDLLGRPIYRKIFDYSIHKYWVSAWAKKIILNKLKVKEGYFSESLLPNICREGFNKQEVIDNNTNKFLFVGRLDPKDSKGLLKVIQAVASIPKVGLDVYGTFTTEQLKYLESFILELNAEERIVILGRINNDKLKVKLPEYSALLMPSNPETFGISYIEALAKNLPILGSKFSGISGYFDEKSYIGLVDEKSQQEICHWIKLFLVNQKQIKNELYHDILEGKLDFLSDREIRKNYIEESQRVATDEC